MYRVIVAEDEDIIRKGLVYSVPWAEMDCCVVAEARNGVEGVEAIRKHRPDIVIADINMPVMDGLKMVRETYEEYEYATIILSGYSSFEYAQEAFMYGVIGYLLKPFEREEIREAVSRAKKELEVRRIYTNSERDKEAWKHLALMEEPVSSRQEQDKVVNQMLDFISENYQKKIVMRDVVDTLNYSETFLNKKFKEAVGVTFIEYLNRYRIQKALELLQADHRMRIQEVAWKCGIGDEKYFRNVFKKYIGCSPKEYVNLIS